MKRLLFGVIAVTLVVGNLTTKVRAESSWLTELANGGRRAIRGSGDVQNEKRDINAVHAIELATIGTLYLELGDHEELTIRAEDNLLEYFTTKVRHGRLRIGTVDGIRLKPRKPVKFYLTVTNLDGIAISSSGDIKTGDLRGKTLAIAVRSSGNLETGDTECDELDIAMSSSGDVYIENLTARVLEVRISSSGDLTISGGKVEKQSIAISSSGDYLGRRLDSQQAAVRVSSSGDATLRVSDYLDARTSSSGDIHYYGSPETVDSRATSSGDVRSAGR